MNKPKTILTILGLVSFICTSLAQFDESSANAFLHKGQISGYTHFNPNNTLPVWMGGRYIPQVNYEINLDNNRKVDFEVSANAYGNIGFDPFDESNSNGDVKPYRVWGRYSTHQFEFRVGLQKINFGSASLLRPLMWFDQIDPRDPLRLTDGVWGALGRYYFLNNANVWIWGLYGNKNTKGWEVAKTYKGKAEYGGRVQLPVSKGEAALSYHHRKANYSIVGGDGIILTSPENRIGFDAKLDLAVGLWLEMSWVNCAKDVSLFSNQETINVGMDYTFGIGNGLTVIYEQLIAAYDKKAFDFDNPVSFSLLNLTYPVGIFDNLSAIVYYDWKNHSAYNFVNWQKQFDKLTLYVMWYSNPKNYNIPTQQTDQVLFAGSGVQVLVVFNY